MFDNKFWEEIKINYPNAYKKFIIDFYKLEYYLTDSFDLNESHFCYCDIEKWFDANGIIIIIDNDLTYQQNTGKVKLYGWIYRIIVIEQEINNEIRNWYEIKTRPKAKLQAIPKAFEIMENQLKEQKE